jgi:hypothetical protein
MKAVQEFFLFIGVVAVASLVVTLPVMWLMNWLIVPSALLAVFGTAHIGFWQAMGIATLCGCLFKGRASSSSTKC